MDTFPSDPPLRSVREPHAVIDDLKTAIWKRRPILGDIMRKHGNKILFEYAHDFVDVNPAPGLDERKPELIEMVRELVAGRLGAAVGEGVAKQLKRLALVSTADHHACIDHPSWVNANIIFNIPFYDEPDPDVRYLVNFSFASVSANNSSGYSRGILFNSGRHDAKALVRLPLLPERLKMSSVYGTRTYSSADLQRAEKWLLKMERGGELSPGRAALILELLKRNFATETVLTASQLCSQITRINHRWWPRIFHGSRGSPPSGKPVLDLVYLDIETLVTQLLIRVHLQKPASLLHRLLFDPKFIERIPAHFNNLVGAFSREEGWGTYMFWGIDREKNRRVGAMLEDGKLVFKNGTESIEWTPEEITKALKAKKIFPGMLLSYITVPLYYGMKCLGGHCQVNDLTCIKQAWRAMLVEMGNIDEAEAVIPVQTKELGGYGLVLTYIQLRSGDYVPATGIDLAIQREDTSFEKYVELSKRVTLMEILSPVLPEMYTDFYARDERDPVLSAVTSDQIFRAVGLQHKLTASESGLLVH